MTYIVSEPLSKEDYLALLKSGEPLELMQILRVGWRLLNPPEFGEQVREAILQRPDISFEEMVELLMEPWGVSAERLSQHPLYPLYLLEGRSPVLAALKRTALKPSARPFHRVTISGPPTAYHPLTHPTFRSFLPTSPQLLQVFWEVPEKQTEAATDPVGGSTSDGGELVRIDQVGGDTDDEADADHQHRDHQHPGNPGVGLDGADDQG